MAWVLRVSSIPYVNLRFIEGESARRKFQNFEMGSVGMRVEGSRRKLAAAGIFTLGRPAWGHASLSS